MSSLSIFLNEQIHEFDHAFAIDDLCITFDSKTRLISISCKIARLSDIDRQLNNASIMRLEHRPFEPKVNPSSNPDNKNIWILNAGIVIQKNATLVIDSKDTSWLKMVPVATMQLSSSTLNLVGQNKTVLSNPSNTTNINNDNAEDGIYSNSINDNNKMKGVIVVSENNGNNPNGIHVFGSLKIDSVKITSWDPDRNHVIKFGFGKRHGEEHTKSRYDTAEPRPFIRVSTEATGTTNITNSEIAYLGYSCSRCSGLSYYGGYGSIIKGNDIHHLLKGYYSKRMGGMIIEENKFHDNYLYGIDPHTGSHDIIIRNNMVYNNNASGIICSKDCYNLLIEGNKVHNNGGVGRGIAFSINTTHSVARNNFVFDNPRCISFNRASDYNEVYSNTISHCGIGIYLANTSSNVIHDNKIADSDNAIIFKDVTNKILNNRIDDTTNGIVLINSSNSSNHLIDIDKQNVVYKEILNHIKETNKITDTKNPTLLINQHVKSAKELEVLSDVNETTVRAEEK